MVLQNKLNIFDTAELARVEEHKYLLDEINDREVYMKGIDHSYYYEGYSVYKTQELG